MLGSLLLVRLFATVVFPIRQLCTEPVPAPIVCIVCGCLLFHHVY
jgi:hypothetical protein